MQPHDLTISGVKIPNTDKFLCEINGILIELRGRSFRLLALLALARVTKKEGWLNIYDLYGTDFPYGHREISRMREELIKQSPKHNRLSWVKWSVTENDRQGGYRLLMNWDRIQVPDDLLERYSDVEVTKAFQEYRRWKKQYEDHSKH